MMLLVAAVVFMSFFTQLPVYGKSRRVKPKIQSSTQSQLGSSKSKVSKKTLKKTRRKRFLSTSLSYGISSDINQPNPVKLYHQNLSVSVSHKLWKGQMSYSAGLGASVYEDGVIAIEEGKESEVWSDIYMGYSKKIAQIRGWKTGFSVSNLLPTSAMSNVAGYGSITSLGLSSSRRVKKSWSLGVNVGTTYIWNQLQYGSHGVINRSYSYGVGGSISKTFIKKITIAFSTGYRISHYLDDTEVPRYTNVLSLGYSGIKWGASLSTSNGNYVDDVEWNPFFYDEYRRVISFGTSYRF